VSEGVNTVDSSAILVPAFPALLRRGMPVTAYGRQGVLVRSGERCRVAYPDEREDIETSWYELRELRLDLRDAAVRDAIVRAIWRKLRPGMIDVHGRLPPDPLTAPHFYFDGHEARLGLAGSPSGCFEYLEFAPMRRPYTDVEVVAFAAIPRESRDRSLLALAEVAKAVFA
jgi:hypothetical protein